MDKSKLIKIISGLGLSENEAKTYLTALSLGPTTILQLSRAASIKRTTVYSVVESLKQKGLIIIEQRGWKQLFVAENPEKLQSILDSRKEQLSQGLPDLLSLYNMQGKETAIKYYEGLEAVKTVYENLIKDVRVNEDYLVLSDSSKWLELDRKYFLDFTKRRSKLNIKTRILLQESEATLEYIKRQKEFNVEVKILPKGVKLSTNLVIMPRRVAVQQLIPPVMAMTTENPSMIQMYKEMFEIMWKSIK